MKKFILPTVLLLFTVSVFAQSDIEKVVSTVFKSKIEGHVYFLASDELKGRLTATDENKIAAQYLANMLRSYGVKPIPKTNSYFQKFRFKKIFPATKREVKIGTLQRNNVVSIVLENSNYKGAAVFIDQGREKDYKRIDVKNKYVISIGGSEIEQVFSKTQEKKILAKQKGALGVIEICNFDHATWEMVEHELNGVKTTMIGQNKSADHIPYIWINDPDEEISKLLTKNKEIDVETTIEGIKESTPPSQNVIGIVEGTDPKLKNEYIIYTAHYDHLGIGDPVDKDSIFNGARDNAVGVSAVLLAAENMVKYPTKRSAIFALFTGEEGEEGFLGSRWYMDHPAIPLDQTVYCFNNDNAAYNDTSIIVVFGLSRTTAEKDMVNAGREFGLNAVQLSGEEKWLFNQSDNIKFAEKGIPAPTFSMGFTSLDDEVMKYYHQAADNPDNVDYDYVLKFVRAYVLAARNIANNPITPFWVEGDEFTILVKNCIGSNHV